MQQVFRNKHICFNFPILFNRNTNRTFSGTIHARSAPSQNAFVAGAPPRPRWENQQRSLQMP